MFRNYTLALPDSQRRRLARMKADPSQQVVRPVEPADYGNTLRFFAGQPDPGDPSRFTIPYQVDGRDGVIEGRLLDDDVKLHPRDGTWKFDAGEAFELPVGRATRPSTSP